MFPLHTFFYFMCNVTMLSELQEKIYLILADHHLEFPNDLKKIENLTHFHQAWIFFFLPMYEFLVSYLPPICDLPLRVSKKPALSSLLIIDVKQCTCDLPGLANLVVAGRQGHVHASYTSPGSGVAAGLKGRYTHCELRWGRPTSSACVGVGDSTPMETHPSGGMKKNRETEGDCRRAAGRRGRVRLRGPERSKPSQAPVMVCGAPAYANPRLSPFPAIRLPDFSFGASRQPSPPSCGHPPGSHARNSKRAVTCS